jgi:hypothetical protein
MNTILILSIFAIGFLAVWKIRKQKPSKQHVEIVEAEPIEIIESAIEKPIAKKKSKKIEDNSTPQKRGRKKKIQN